MRTISNNTQDHQGADQPAAAPNPDLEKILDLEKIPFDYRSGYKKALALDPKMASNYVAHAWVGDPLGDELIKQLNTLPQGEMHRLIKIAIDDPENNALRDAPQLLLDLVEEWASPPDWVDQSGFRASNRMFHRESRTVLLAFVCGVLIEGFTTNIAKSFVITGRVRDSGVRRLMQNNRHMVEMYLPGGLERYGDGWKLSARIRLAHAQVRYLLNNSPDWHTPAWGVPISAAHTGFAVTAFSARLLKHMKRLGAVYNEEEAKSFMDVWRYSGHLMGIPDTILFRDEKEALKLYDVGLMCEPDIPDESIMMANSLVQSAPLIAGATDPKARRDLAKLVFMIARALLGNEQADELMFPKNKRYGILFQSRMQARYNRIMNRCLPRLATVSDIDRFSGMLGVSVYDEGGISYRLPDHVYSEESSKW